MGSVGGVCVGARRMSSRGDYEMGSVCVCVYADGGGVRMCAVKIVNTAVDWPPLIT